VRPLARLLVVVGAVGIGWFLFGATPRDVVLVYDVAGVPDATALEVEIRRGGDLVRRARLALDRGAPARHPVRLRDGTYGLSWRLEGARESPIRGDRELVVTGDETIVLPLGR
jgi:hypothetical protein